MGGVAEAHANYVRSNPGADARLQRAPAEVRVEFSEPPDPKGSELAVLDASGARVDKGDTGPSGATNELRVSLQPLGEGGYVIAWTAVSTVDGHLTKGSFVFAVGNAPLPAVPDVGEAAPPPRALEIAGRAMSFAGIALLLGGSLFALVVRPAASPAEEGREQLLLALGGALLVAGAIALLLNQGGSAPQRLAQLLTIRGLAGVAVLGGAAALSEGRLRRVALGAGLVGALSTTLVSHSAAVGGLVQMGIDLVHLTAALTWAGGIASLAVVVLPAARSMAPAELGRTVGRFSTFAVTSVAFLLVSALVQSFQRLVLVQDLWETPFGIALAAKAVLLAAALAIASLNLFRWGPRLRAARGVETARSWLGLGVRAELGLIAAILVATGALTALVPPAQRSGAAFDQTRHAGGLREQLLLASASPGQNRYVLRVSDGLTPVTDVVRVAFRFTMIEHDMGESELVAEQRAPGEYVATGNATVMFGTWRVETIVRRPGQADARTIFEVPIGAPTGPGAVARAVSAPPYDLIVYVDPPQPVGGAPVTLNVIVVSATGDPVTGKTLRIAFSGAGSESAVAKETSPGHYEASLAAIDAGKWKAAIAVGTEAKGDYEFEVAR